MLLCSHVAFPALSQPCGQILPARPPALSLLGLPMFSPHLPHSPLTRQEGAVPSSTLPSSPLTCWVPAEET